MYKPTKTEADERIIAQFNEQVDQIERAIKREESKKAERLIDSLISDLEALSIAYLATELPRHFKRGSIGAVEELEKVLTDVKTAFTDKQKKVLAQQVEITKAGFQTAIDGIRKNSKKILAQGILQKLLQAITAETDITRIVVGGRSLSIEHYISQVVYTTSAQTQNLGAITRYQENGIKYVQVVERAQAPDAACQFMNGKIVKVGDLNMTPPYHPNCFGSVIPVVGEPSSQPLSGIDDERIPEEARKIMKRFS